MTETELEALNGLTLKEVKEKLGSAWTVRIVSIGDTHFMGTCDFRTDRLNVALSSEGLVKTNVIVKTFRGEDVAVENFPSEANNNFENAKVLSVNIG